MKTKNILIALLLFQCFISFGQMDVLRLAFIAAEAGKMDSAKIYVDAACKHPETNTNEQAHYLKGFIYSELFRKPQPHLRKLELATEAFVAFKKSIEIDGSAENKQNNFDGINNLSKILRNTSGSTIDTVNYLFSIKAMESSKTMIKYLKPTINVDSISSEYYFVLGSYFQNVVSTMNVKDPERISKYLKITEDVYNKVLIVEPNNPSANYNMAIVYYNQAVNLVMNKLNLDYDLAALEDITDESARLFKKSLPYMIKAYQLNPKRPDIVKGLSGIYYSMNELELYKKFDEMLKDLENQK